MTEKLDILLNYDTILFDLDGTLWDVLTETGQRTRVVSTVPPFEVLSTDTIQDSQGTIIRLHSGIREVMRILSDHGVALGVVTRSGDPNVPFSAQPAVMILKAFDLYKYLNDAFIVVGQPKGTDKGGYARGDGKTLLIDDDGDNLQEVTRRGLSDVLNRNAFVSWGDFLLKGELGEVALRTGKQLLRLAKVGQVWQFGDGTYATVSAVDSVRGIVWLVTPEGGSLYVDTVATNPRGTVGISGSTRPTDDYNFERNRWFQYEPAATHDEELDLPMHGGFYTDWRLKDKQRKEKEQLYDPTRENLQLWTGQSLRLVFGVSPDSTLPAVEGTREVEKTLKLTSNLIFGYGPRFDETPSAERTPEEVDYSTPYTDVQLRRRNVSPFNKIRDWVRYREQVEDTDPSNRYDYAIV